jgi:hypothetical protein
MTTPARSQTETPACAARSALSANSKSYAQRPRTPVFPYLAGQDSASAGIASALDNPHAIESLVLEKQLVRLRVLRTHQTLGIRHGDHLRSCDRL